MMTQQSNQYSDFSFEDFLQDAYFIESVKHPGEASRLFWEKYRQGNPGNLDEYNAALKFIGDTVKEQLTGSEVSAIWENIKPADTPVKRMKPVYYVISLAVAASIAALLILMPFRGQRDTQPREPDILAFATENKLFENRDTTETQLILSDKKTVLLPEKESVITYDSLSIRLKGEEVLKEESAVFNQLIVPRGNRSMLVLHDGTRIWINAGTRVVYPLEFAENKREIFVDGEIYLDVASEAHRPFMVRTLNTTIQVLGTKFNVQAYSQDAQEQVALESGSVKIISGGSVREVLLSPDTMYEYTNGKATVTDVDIRKHTSWVYGLYIYESERLDVILARLSRYYGVDIVADTESAKLKCSGKLSLKETIDDVLKGLSYTAPVTYTGTDGKYFIRINQRDFK